VHFGLHILMDSSLAYRVEIKAIMGQSCFEGPNEGKFQNLFIGKILLKI
jgi:hypothetical protein